MITFDPIRRQGILELYYNGKVLKGYFDWKAYLVNPEIVEILRDKLIGHIPQEQEYESHIYY